MNRKRLKRVAAMMMAVVLTVCAATPAGSFAFASGADAQSNTAEEAVTEENREPELYDSRLNQLAFDDEMFDIVLTNGVIHNAFTCEEYKQCLKECVRILKTTGVLYLSVFTSDTVDEKLEKVEEHVYLTPDGLRMVLFNKEEIIQMLSDLNYQMIEECALYDIQVETGVRSLFRAIYQKRIH